MAETRYVFNCEWYDETAQLIRPYQFTFYPKDNSIELFDVKNRRLFLKRTEYRDVDMDKLYIGSVLSRFFGNFLALRRCIPK